MKLIFVLICLTIFLGCDSSKSTQNQEISKAIEQAQQASQQAAQAANQAAQEAINATNQMTIEAQKMAADAQKNMEEAKARLGTVPNAQNPSNAQTAPNKN